MCPLEVSVHLGSRESLTNEGLIKFRILPSGQIITEGLLSVV